jgi:hypothetical protein
VIRQAHLIAVVGAFLMGCTVVLVVGCAGVRSEASQKEEQDHAEAPASEEARCSQTRTFKIGDYLLPPRGKGNYRMVVFYHK